MDFPLLSLKLQCGFDWAPSTDAVRAFEARLQEAAQLQPQIEVVQTATRRLSPAVVATLCIRVALRTRRLQIGTAGANGASGEPQQGERLGHRSSRDARALRSAALGMELSAELAAS